MKLDLTQIFEGSIVSLDFEKQLSEIDTSEMENKIDLPITLNGNVYGVDGEVFLSGKVSYKYNGNCDRCLKSLKLDREEELSAKIIKENKLEDTQEYMVDDEDDSTDYFVLYKDGEIFIEELIKDTLILNEPMKVICIEECRGLCPVCGINRNTESCDCRVDNIDPRLAKLKEFSEKNK